MNRRAETIRMVLFRVVTSGVHPAGKIWRPSRQRRSPGEQERDLQFASTGRILKPPPKARGNGPRLCAEHQPQRHGEATRFGIIQRLCASALAAAGPSDTAAVRWWFQDAPEDWSLSCAVFPFHTSSSTVVLQSARRCCVREKLPRTRPAGG